MMNRLRLASAFLIFVILGAISSAQSLPAPTTDWELTANVLGYKLGERMKLKIDQGQISGEVYIGESVALKGTIRGSEVNFDFKESDGTVTQCTGHISGDVMSGDYVNTDPHGIKTTGTWSAHRRSIASRHSADT